MFPPGVSGTEDHFFPEDDPEGPVLLWCPVCNVEFDVDDPRDDDCPVCRTPMEPA